jgi:uncharacterized membrane protein
MPNAYGLTILNSVIFIWVLLVFWLILFVWRMSLDRQNRLRSFKSVTRGPRSIRRRIRKRKTALPYN